ncbi:tRNA-specific adenosine deaminase OS=Castellaniella defragrans (strain DSM / CCUG 39792 / 65Phen)OX=1437824 GN=tadA PE=3 SV=1 [Castellaniella denitrificans]
MAESLDDDGAMALALEQARRAAELGEVPVGAVVLDAGGRLLAAGHNRTILDRDPTAHAEVVALRAAARRLDNYRLTGARLYVTLEPCAMCLGAMFHARLAEIVYGAPDPKTGACGGVVDLSVQPRLNHHARVRGGVGAQACGDLLRGFFRARREAARAARAAGAPASAPGTAAPAPAPDVAPVSPAPAATATLAPCAASVSCAEAPVADAALFRNHPPMPKQKSASSASAALASRPAPGGEHTHLVCDDPGCGVHHVHEQPSGIYLISPSGAVADPAALDLAAERLRALGFRVAVDRTALAVHERFAGTDKQRLASIQRALKQKHPVVMATRGGYGLSRLLPHIDWRAVADSGKTFIGQSDFTAFSLALLARTGAVSLAGPTAIFDFGGKKVDDLTQALFQETLSGELEILSFESPDADPVDARGVLWGGNLAMVASLVGTPYLPDVKGGILFLEDVSEHPFRIERMLTQLWHAGVLEKQHAIVLGQFTDYRLAPHDKGYDLDSVVRWLRKTVRVPVVTGLPYGHVKVKATLPVGARVGIATEDGMAHLVLREHTH